MSGDFDARLAGFLSHEESRSGQSIAEELGCSRTAVWKHVEALRARGIGIEALAGLGYRLNEPLELLDEQQIRLQVQEPNLGLLRKITIVGTIGSTNSCLLSKDAEDQHGQAILAECQTEGRGRRGQPWISPFGRNIYASLGWRFEQGAGELGCLPLLLALSVSEALKRCGLSGHRIKWPNDILLNNRKLAGCLVEIQGDVSGPCHAVLGVGINVRMRDTAPGANEIDQPWTDVSSEISDISRNQLAGALLDEMLGHLERFSRTGFEAFMVQWEAQDGLAGTPVTLRHPTGVIEGIAAGISKRGGLLLQTDQGVGEYTAGEISMERKEQRIDHD